MEVFWDVTTCGWVSCAWRFEVSQCLHLQGQGNLDCCTKALGSFETSVCTHPATQPHSPDDHLKSCCVTGATRQLLDAEEEDPPTHWLSMHQQWVSSPDTRTELLLLYSKGRTVSTFICVLVEFRHNYEQIVHPENHQVPSTTVKRSHISVIK